MMSTQRFILIMLALNLIVGVASEMYYNTQTYNTTQYSTETTLAENSENELKKEDGAAGLVKLTATRVWESPLATPIRVAITLFKIFARGLIPFSILPSQFTSEPEHTLAWILVWFRSMFWVVIAIEIYMIRTNKKVS